MRANHRFFPERGESLQGTHQLASRSLDPISRHAPNAVQDHESVIVTHHSLIWNQD